MDSHHWGVFLGPIATCLVFGIFALWVKKLIARHAPPWLRAVMLKERWRSRYSDEHRKALEGARSRVAPPMAPNDQPVESILKDAMDKARGRDVRLPR